MKKYFLIILSFLAFSFSDAQTSDTLTNETIIKLHQAGFGSEVLKSKINTSAAKFDVSVNGMLKLKDNKVPDEVINMMVSSPGGFAAKTVSAPTGGGQNNAAVNTGIFFIKSVSETVEMTGSFINSRKTDRSSQIFVGGFADAEIKVILNENQSALQIADKSPKFQFVFDTLKNNNENSWFGKSSGPKNFFLVKLKATKKTRELVIGKTNAFEDKIEIKEKQKILLKNKRIGPGVYEVSPISPLEAGEYGIVFSNAVWDTQSGKIYDFSVKK